MNDNQRSKCHAIIHSAAGAAAACAAGLAQIPGADNGALVPIEIAMIVSLGKVFGFTVSESYAKSILMTAAATVCGRTISQILVGWLPGIGNAINAATAASMVESIGWISAEEFDTKERYA